MTEPKYTNALIDESSPYLRQHAHNPVDWLPWSEDVMRKAREENKLILVSIGYSTCHWCHVMERESFESEEVAEVMNRHFVCVKIDREERPDLDQIYMDAVQLMHRMGGWPLNCITTPEGNPVYGGTYFPKDDWVKLLRQLAELWREDPDRLEEYGSKVAKGLQVEGALPVPTAGETYDFEPLDGAVAGWKKRFDRVLGGPDRAPKFPMPVNYSFLLHYGQVRGDDDVLEHVRTTLDHMAKGGIHDHIGGGFARYATDKAWKVPHFEKMLYDNAQLLSLYSKAARVFDSAEYRLVAEGIKRWLATEMKHSDGGYSAALDADSEGVEGKYYTWSTDLSELDPDAKAAFSRYFYTDDNALWEGRLIPVRKTGVEDISRERDVPTEEVVADLRQTYQTLYGIREERIRPGLDDKRICSWNALLATAYLDAARYIGDPSDVAEAKSILKFIENELHDHERGVLRHTSKEPGGQSPDFLEDYAHVIEAYLALYALEFDESDLLRAKELAMTAIDRFYDESKGLFFFVSEDAEGLISRPTELADNVMPSSNSVMAENLLILSQYFHHEAFERIAMRLVGGVRGAVSKYGDGYARWADLYMRLALGSPEMVVAGSEALEVASRLKTLYMPAVTRAAATESGLPTFDNRLGGDQTRIYICRHRACDRPSDDADEAVERLRTIYQTL